MAGSAASTFAPNAAGASTNCRSSSWFQFCPYWCGLPTRVIRLAPNTAAATTAATATIVPASALRTGTAVRPRPGSNAIRTPMLPATDPARPSADPSRDGRAGSAGSATPSGPRARPAARQAAWPSTASGSTAMHAEAHPEDGQVDLDPGAGSASRAGPIGISGEAATATADRDDGPRERHRGQPGQGQRRQAGPGHAQRAQDRELGRVQHQLPGQQLAHHRQRDQPGQHGEHRQRHRLRPDRPLRGRDLVGQVHDGDAPAGGRVPFRQRAGGMQERGHARARP